MTVEPTALRLQRIRTHHLDFPCGAWSKEDECFLLSELNNREAKVRELKEELSTINSEHQELVQVKEQLALLKVELNSRNKELVQVKEQFEFSRVEFTEQLSSLKIELKEVQADRIRLQKMSEEAYLVGRDKGLTEAAETVRKLAEDILPKDYN